MHGRHVHGRHVHACMCGLLQCMHATSTPMHVAFYRVHAVTTHTTGASTCMFVVACRCSTTLGLTTTSVQCLPTVLGAVFVAPGLAAHWSLRTEASSAPRNMHAWRRRCPPSCAPGCSTGMARQRCRSNSSRSICCPTATTPITSWPWTGFSLGRSRSTALALCCSGK